MERKKFDATYIHTSEEDDYYLLGFSDGKIDFSNYVMLQMAYGFDDDDIANGMDGEYFEYNDQAYCGYKRVKKAIVSEQGILFHLHGISDEFDQIEVRIQKELLTSEVLDYLQKVLGDKLFIQCSQEG